MPKVDVKFAELHNPLFLAGKNLGQKLDPSKLAGLKLIYDSEEKELLVTWEGTTGHVPSPGVAVYVPGIVEKPAVAHVHPIVAGMKVTAQVSGPQMHVHMGPGHGQTGRK